LVENLINAKMGAFAPLIEELKTHMITLTQQQQQPQPQPQVQPPPAPQPRVEDYLRELKRASNMLLRQLDNVPFTNFPQKQSFIGMREQVGQLNVIMQLLQKMETDIDGMDEAATRIYIKEGFAAIKEEIAAVSAEINFNASIAVKVDTHGPSFAAVAKRELAGTYQGDFARTADAIAAATKICIQERGASSSSSSSYPTPGRGSAPYHERHGGDRDFQTRPVYNQNGKRVRQDHGKLPDNVGSRP
jgi:F0F1-type ATP synthase epsilon subunit